MKSINKFTALILAVTAMAFTACSEKGAEYDPALVDASSDQVYFSNKDNSKTFLLDNGQTSINIDVYRTSAEGNCTVSLTKTTNDNIFNIPASVTFADGQTQATFPVTFDFNYFLENADTNIPLSIALGNDLTLYGDAVVNVFVKYAPWSEWYGSLAEWKAAGYDAGDWPLSSTEKKGTYIYNLFVVGEDKGMPVFFRTSLLDPNKVQFKLGSVEDDFGWLYGVDFIIDGVKAQKADGKTIYNLEVNSQLVGYTHPSYGDVYIIDHVKYWRDVRDAAEEEDTYEYYPCVYDPSTGDFILNVVYYVPAGYFGDGEEKFEVDGFVRKDYTIAMAYAGGFIDGKTAGAIVNMTKGADVAKFRYYCAPGALSEEEVAKFVDLIYNEEIDATESSESSAKIFYLAEDGDYTVVAVLYDDEGKKVGSDYYTFTYKYVGGEAKETWTPMFKGTWTYTLFFGDEEEPEYDTDRVLSVCDQNENRYQISGIFYGVDFVFEMDDEGIITFEDQYIGYDHPDYGSVYVANVSAYDPTEYGAYPSYYDPETGDFNFALAYFCEAGTFAVGYETFTLTGRATAKTRSAKTAKDFTPRTWTLTEETHKAAKAIKSRSLTRAQALNHIVVNKK